ncbi:IclR family transcriptional regulator [uncultured Veillonella sp.]|uniref:IclR family transcriptional regulator n=1 Tax=uncultured Veillonella sp. TaxID=159268 RepID=UPI002620055B|nr:IclR family transcriptional regulator [uncultured Veillonella sp.]
MKSIQNSNQHKPTLRVVKVLEAIASSHGLTLSQIADTLDCPKSTLTPILKTLVDTNYLHCEEDSLIYTMGKQAFIIGNTYDHQADILDLIKEQMEIMSLNCKETVHLGVLEGSQIMYLQKVTSPKPLQLISSVGKRLPAYATALGKALLMDHREEQLAELFSDPLPSLTEKTLPTVHALYQNIHADTNNEFTYEEEEITKYARCIARPLRVNKKIVAALSISFIIFDGSQEHIETIKENLRRYGTIIEKLMATKNFHY